MRRSKYDKLLDPESWAYIDRVNAWYPPDAIDQPIEKQRATYDAMCVDFHEGRPPGVVTADFEIDAPGRAIPMRRYDLAGGQRGAVVLYYHGGGFVLGGLDSHDDICAEICAGTGFSVLSVNYRLAPEHVHPAAFDDACAAFDWTAENIDLPIVLTGESAGGNLAAAVAHAMRGGPVQPVGQVLIYPGLGGQADRGSYVEHSDAPLLTVRETQYYRGVRTGGAPATDDPTLEPLRDTDFSRLPPTVIVTAECDPLSSDGEAYRDRVVAVGGPAWWREEPRLTHSFLRSRRTVARAGEAFAHIVEAIAALGRGDRPSFAAPESSLRNPA